MERGDQPPQRSPPRLIELLPASETTLDPIRVSPLVEDCENKHHITRDQVVNCIGKSFCRHAMVPKPYSVHSAKYGQCRRSDIRESRK